ncbi:MAG: L-threonylcarbamoyladenylate synthase [Patescibacteria group bacterium]|nr:L-threonylcarbamoyladenylate synthase [Patescibacteria group bacterium]
MIIKGKVLKIVKNISPGKFLTYIQVAKLAGSKKYHRLVAKLMAKNEDIDIPCHRVIKNDYTVGKYNKLLIKREKIFDPKEKKNLLKLSSKIIKSALLLKEGTIGLIPTDTIYGICGSALKKNVVEKIYQLRRRSPQKPMIILISDYGWLKNFGILLNLKEKEILNKIWPGKISVILKIKNKNLIKKLTYLHRGTKTLSFRFPKLKWLQNLLKISGPLVAPSANWEGYEPAKTIKEAKKYFGKEVFYLEIKKNFKSDKRRKYLPSTLIRLENSNIEILRKGAGYRKLLSIF